jgi:hypothetical protein
LSVAIVSAVLLVVLAAEGATAVRQAAAPGEEFLLARGRAGYLELGQSGDEVYGRFGRENVRLVDTFSEGTFTPALEVRLDVKAAGPALVAQLEGEPCGRITVWGISVYDDRFRTSDGLGVGSTLGGIRKRFKPEVSEAESGPAAYVEALGLTFGLDASGLTSDSSKVLSVWVVPQPVLVRERRCPHLGPLQDL